MIHALIGVINWLFGLLILALALRVALPWFGIMPYNPVMRFIVFVTDPVLRPLYPIFTTRLLGSAMFTVDPMPLIVILLLWVIRNILVQILYLILNPPLWLFYPGQDVGRWLAGVVGFFFQLYTLALLIRALMEWFFIPPYRQPWARFIRRITDPLLRFIRRILGMPLITGYFDISFLIAFIVVLVLRILITSFLLSLNLQL